MVLTERLGCFACATLSTCQEMSTIVQWRMLRELRHPKGAVLSRIGAVLIDEREGILRGKTKQAEEC
jgi:hypothetical protein